jgi:hypothetical protein
MRLQGQDALAVRASKKLKNEGLLLTEMAGTVLKMELDRVPLWRGDHVAVKQLADDFARYLYLPRLKGPEVLIAAIQNGASLLRGNRKHLRRPKATTRIRIDTSACEPGK